MFIDAVMSEATGTLRRAAQGVKLTVDQNNILEAVRIIETEAAHFEAQVKARAERLKVHAMGGDPVSKEAARVLTEKLLDGPDSYVKRCLQYVRMLEDLAIQLGESARTYGYSEEAIAAQFNAAKLEGTQMPLALASPAHRPYRGMSAI
jgi:hypothetical protein